MVKRYSHVKFHRFWIVRYDYSGGNANAWAKKLTQAGKGAGATFPFLQPFDDGAMF